MTYESPVLVLLTCDSHHERHGQAHHAMDEAITGHRLHCPECDCHLTSLLLCPECGERYMVIRTKDAKQLLEALVSEEAK